MRCDAMRCDAMRCDAMQFNTPMLSLLKHSGSKSQSLRRVCDEANASRRATPDVCLNNATRKQHIGLEMDRVAPDASGDGQSRAPRVLCRVQLVERGERHRPERLRLESGARASAALRAPALALRCAVSSRHAMSRLSMTWHEIR